jgi:hypothetical protein
MTVSPHISLFPAGMGRGTGEQGAAMLQPSDLRWLLIIPAMLSVGFMIWVFLEMSKDIRRKRRRYIRFVSPREKTPIRER